MYQQDSFFDLSGPGQIGLLIISTTLFLLMLWLARALFGKRGFAVSVPGALLLFWLFVWLSPQVYYMYYRMLIPSLPLQWVILSPPGILDALKLMIFQGPQNLSAHSQGLLGWALLIVSNVRPWSARGRD